MRGFVFVYEVLMLPRRWGGGAMCNRVLRFGEAG